MLRARVVRTMGSVSTDWHLRHAEIQKGKRVNAFKPPGTPKRTSKLPKIVIPNSMWTAGCCVSGKKVLGSFAVIGNNDSNKLKTLMSRLTVSNLEITIGIIDLFPGNSDCQKSKYDVYI